MFFRAVDSGQFDDLERQGRITLFEERRGTGACSRRRATQDESSGERHGVAFDRHSDAARESLGRHRAREAFDAAPAARRTRCRGRSSGAVFWYYGVTEVGWQFGDGPPSSSAASALRICVLFYLAMVPA